MWFLDEYYMYAAAIVLMSAFGITSFIYQTRKNERKLHETIHSHDTVVVCRGGGTGKSGQQQVFETVSSQDLVPGDVIQIPQGGCQMLCDAVLVSGSCIGMQTSVLLGISVLNNSTNLSMFDFYQ